MRFVFLFLFIVLNHVNYGQQSSDVLDLSKEVWADDKAVLISEYFQNVDRSLADSLNSIFEEDFGEISKHIQGDFVGLTLAGSKRDLRMVMVFDARVSHLLIAIKVGQEEAKFYQTGLNVSPLQGAYKTSAINAVPIEIPANGLVNVCIMVPASYDGELWGEIKTFEPFDRRVDRRLRVSYIFTAILFTFAIYNLLLALLVRRKVYFYYSYYIFAFGFYASIIATTLLFSMSVVAPFSVISAAILISTGAKFSGEFLDIEDHQSRARYYYRFLVYSAYGIAPVMLLNFLMIKSLGLNNIIAIGTAFIGLSTIPFWLWVGFSIYRKGNPKGKLFLLTNIPLLIGCCVFISIWLMDHLGFISVSSHLAWATNMILFISVLFQLFLFSYVIGYSIKKLQNEKLLIQQEINQKLEAQVAERTASLRAAKDSIEEQKSELAELNRVKDNLFSIVSHDLRNPLNSVKGVLELIKKSSFQGEELQMVAGKLENSLDGTMNLLDNLLFWAKSQMDGIQAKPELIRPKDIIENNLKLALMLVREKDLTIETNLIDAQAYADSDMIDLVVRNLLSNAIKFTPAKGIIQLNMSADEHKVDFSLKDNGIGMSQQLLRDLFSADKNHTSYGTNNEKGYGLGLKLCKDFVEINGGQLNIESVEHQGSSFTVTLPSKA